VENRDDKRPQLSDLARIRLDRAGRRRGAVRLSRGILPKNSEPRRSPDEIVADIKTPEYLAWEEKMMKVKGTADVIIAKQRHGPTGTVQLGFQAEFTRFADLADNSYAQFIHDE
jgi:replicative DNA helicase